ncbi:type I-E CRISPR-associated protein Cse2/CasB [Phytopseudomonas dryadis]|uniref:Type I-E CRISPR-associated protein Cse2/CasB n=1 Tax=Phytopseudomonas dryadis TaxID=2487520 RepID=A0A4Q9QYY7_9GAMM|nr:MULTISPECIES: type I-E CRISPR-associated protein Cse2/CasB [Pseudomonas]TBU90903.1 type I-E CRISPR-associated protein Cse2/CasB [Pseudomonas dryadis]TBV08941.1 type I-E CRISPR-associated protein Cse2/CasB [Pseudomonas dryadis]TBV15126.1 type I-E CRISPR-associated protein Cse2/CasB [Pseudomonas sp. FRB 230]
MSEFAQSFIAHLQRLHERDRGALAILRRSLGFAPGVYAPAYPYVERFVAAERHAQDASRLALYLTAGLFATHPRQAAKSLATSLGELMRQRDSASIEQRFIALLSADAENLAIYLRQIISLLAADDRPLDYGVLLRDLSVWLNPYIDSERRNAVRQRWARDFYRALAAPAADHTAQAAND